MVASRHQLQAQTDTQEVLDSARSKAQFEERVEIVRAQDAAPSQDEEDREPVRRHLEADAMWKSHLRSDLWPWLGGLQEANVGEPLPPTIANGSRTCRADTTRVVMECHGEAVSSQGDTADSDTCRGRDECP